jgi:hypothetical protein
MLRALRDGGELMQRIQLQPELFGKKIDEIFIPNHGK